MTTRNPNLARYQKILPYLRPLYTIPNCYLVGGSIRDMLIGRTTIDLDIVVAGAESVVAAIEPFINATILVLGKKEGFKCYRVVIRGVPEDNNHQASVDSITENYWFDLSELRNGKVLDDLGRRDFTVNAMAMPLRVFMDYVAGCISKSEAEQSIIDPHHGRLDLASSFLRQVTDTLFLDDPLRLWRLWRIAAELNFKPTAGLKALASRDIALITKSAGERVRNELFTLLSQNNAAYYLSCAADCGLLTAQFPVLEKLDGCLQGDNNYEDVWQHSLSVVKVCDYIIANLDYLWPANQCRTFFQRWLDDGTNISVLKFAALFHDIGKPETKVTGSDSRIHFYGHEKSGLKAALISADKVRFSNKEKALLKFLIGRHLQIHDIIKRANRRTKARFWRDHQEQVAGLILLGLADLMAKKGPRVEPDQVWLLVTRIIPEFVAMWLDQREDITKAMPLLDGNSIMSAFDLPQGELVGIIKETVWSAQIEGRVNNRDEALQLAKAVIDRLHY